MRAHRSRASAPSTLSFSVEPDRFAETHEALEGASHPVSVFDRGIFHSLYTRDHNGLTIELARDTYDVPVERRAEVLATTQRLREADGADYAEDEHLAATLEELGLPVERNELPDAPAGAGVD
jgi:hypothetical protein